MSMTPSELALTLTTSTSVDIVEEHLSATSSFPGAVPTEPKSFPGGLWSCFRSQRFNPEDAIFPSITKKLVARHEGSEEAQRRRRRFIKRREINPSSYITLHKTITIGKYAVYYFGTEKSSSEPKLVKIYRPTLLLMGPKRAGMEKQILSLQDKPAVLPSVHFAFKYQFFKCLVLEPMYNESLKEKLLHARRLMPEVVQSFMVDMVCAVSFLHNNKVLHRNLTLDSFWIQANRRLKLTDFSYCIHKRAISRWNTVFRVKPTEFTAPELFSYSPYSRQTDIWALGVIFYRMSSGRFPFYGRDPKDLKMKIQTAKESYGDFFSATGQVLCSEMLEKDPAHRIGHLRKTDIGFRNHIYFDDIDWESAHYHSENGPPIRWKFPVSDERTEIQEDEPLTINFEDPNSFDMDKMKIKPFRMEAIKDGNYMFSPEYLEQVFPSAISEPPRPSQVRQAGLPRTSKVMRFSLRFHLLEAFRDLEKDLESDDRDTDSVFEEYFSSISKNIDKYTKEKEAASIEQLTDIEHDETKLSVDKYEKEASERERRLSSGSTV
ncbi:protein kinase C [Elysia marginata]|uniref:Protein kinase C n=1 Tax=Elysia marginata TaxID=1093978 RepID=A0AAV4HCN6_9GAST|nr:protein kinase C [Elysia marginata]